MLLLAVDEEQREENVNASEQHNDVAEQVHKFNFLEVVEDDSNQIEGGTTNQHAEAFCRKNFEKILCNYETREACEYVENYVQLCIFLT